MAHKGMLFSYWHIVCSLLLLLAGALSLTTWAGNDTYISSAELVERLAVPTDLLVLDVRTAKEFQAGHIPGAQNIPHTELPKRLAALADYQQKTVVVYCESGVRSSTASRVLQTAGFANVRHLQGDMAAWRAQALPMTTSSGRP